jgi:alpha-amylase/alpha-mannosidase (GH57 family)
VLDPLEELAEINTASLSYEQHRELTRWLLTLRDPMMEGLPRLASIVAHLRSHDHPALSEQEWRDAQVLFHLAWCGPVTRRRSEPIRRLLEQGAHYSEDQKVDLLKTIRGLVAEVVPTMLEQSRAGHIEISITPFHHPILPLLIDTDAAGECMPRATLPSPAYRAPFHARRHVRRALDDWQRRSGTIPSGMWPAEGSLSMEALEVLAASGVRWTATDEGVLRASAGELFVRSDVYFPYEVATTSGNMMVLFRDHGLSDAIGFEYASWDSTAAAADFMRRLEERRQLIIHEHGASALEQAVIPVILDGENCWEFYHHNGEDFLRSLLQHLEDDDRFTCVTCGEVADSGHARRLDRLRAGSWINADFGVWIGSPAKNCAWTLLGRAMQALRNAGHDEESIAEHLEVLEASDWFWWYDERHQAPHKDEFDATFRARLRRIFEICHTTVPDELARPLSQASDAEIERAPVTFGTSAMHRNGAIVRDVSLETSDSWQRLRVRLERRPAFNEELVVQALGDDGIERACLITEDELLWRSPHRDENSEWFADDELALYVHSGRHWVVLLTEEDHDGHRRTSRVELNQNGAYH